MHAEKRAGPGGQNNGGTFPGSQANSDSSQPVTTDLSFLNRPFLSSPRAESARAVTGRRCPHSREGEDFLTGQPDFFTKTAVTPERKVEKSFPRWEINRHAEG